MLWEHIFLLTYKANLSAEYVEGMTKRQRHWHIERLAKAIQDEADAIERASKGEGKS